MKTIDLDQYQAGRRAFAEGASLLSIAEKVIAANATNNDDTDRAVMSFGLGFLDAAFDRLRGITA